MHDLTNHIVKEWTSLQSKNVFVACSGGLDSVVLLHLLKGAGISSQVIHVNYHLRGDDSNKDADFVSSLANVMDLSFERREVELEKELAAGGNMQAMARDFRYNWFREILARNPDNRILLGHHADDQVETFFLNLARSSGVMGLSCMKPEHNGIVRPLLNYSKEELTSFAKEHNLNWREDKSNSSNKYRRNRLRNEILPHVRTEIETIDSSVLTLISSFQRLQSELEDSTRELIEEIKLTDSVSYASYNALSSLERIELFRQLGISAKVAIRVEHLKNSEKGKLIEIDHSKYHAIVKDHDQFTFLSESKDTPSVEISLVQRLPIRYSKDEIFLDGQKLTGKLQIRRWQLEDRIAPVGMSGSQLISDIIKDAKLSAQRKEDVLVVHDNDNIHWCIGLKIGRLAIANKDTEQILKCQISA